MPLSAPSRRLAVLAATLVGVASTANLGAWQLRRAAAKLDAQQQLDENAARPVLEGGAFPVAAAPATGSASPSNPPTASAASTAAAWPVGRRVRLLGRWVPEDAVYLENRSMAGRVGFILVMPLRLADRPEAVLVQRGWVPRDANDRTRLPAVETPSGPVEVDGRVAPPPGRLFEFAPSPHATLRQNLDLPGFAAETGLRLLPGSVQQLDPPGSARGVLRRDWPAPAVDVQKHYGYAFQWFAMCTLMAVLHVWFQLVRPRLRRTRAG